MSQALKIRVGVPLPGGRLARGARALGAPLLISANALAKRDKYGWFSGWRTNIPDLDGADLALDSAGFVAWARYGAFPWTVALYLELVASRSWSWWAAMDACVEPEVAGSPSMVRLRQAETVRLWIECSRGARVRGLTPPMPVLQGWTPADYTWIARELESLGAFDGRELVGVGSMCRRHIHGPVGLLAVLDTLDAILPSHVRLHLFGVKGGALPYLGAYGNRVASIDSMAWDVAARRRAHRDSCSCSTPLRLEEMGKWYGAQVERVNQGHHGLQGALLPSGLDAAALCDPALDAWAMMVMDDEIGVREAAHYLEDERHRRSA